LAAQLRRARQPPTPISNSLDDLSLRRNESNGREEKFVKMKNSILFSTVKPEGLNSVIKKEKLDQKIPDQLQKKAGISRQGSADEDEDDDDDDESESKTTRSSKNVLPQDNLDPKRLRSYSFDHILYDAKPEESLRKTITGCEERKNGPSKSKFYQSRKRHLNLVDDEKNIQIASYLYSEKSLDENEELFGEMLQKKGNKSLQTLCMICETNLSNTIISPCGHSGICFQCLEAMVATERSHCHYCRQVE